MKREVISEAVGNIADKHIEEAAGFEVIGKTSRSWRKYLPLAACLCLLVVGIGGFVTFKVAHPWGFRIEVLEGERGASKLLTEIARIPHWEERPIYSQYASLEWNGMNYDAKSAEIPAERIGEFLGETRAVGYDYYAEDDEAERVINVKVYSVTELSEECVVAVQYEGTDTWYGFGNAYYRPETLGQFVEDMNMYEDIVFDTVYYSYDNMLGQYVSVQFDDVDDMMVREYLLSKHDAVNTYDEQLLHMEPRRIMGISVDIPILGIENISLEVCEDGYIKTNIMATGKLFYIGEENTLGFVDYVLNECDGYETIYIYEDSGIIDSLFGGEPEVELLDRLFGGAEQGAADSSESANTQSSEGYNPEGAASPSMAPVSNGE